MYLHTNLRYISRLFLFVLLSSTSIYNAYCIKGNVTDNYGKVVPYAVVRYYDQSDPKKVYVGEADANGNYNVDAPLINYADGDKNFIFFDAYPNPSSSGVVIPFHLSNSGNLGVYVYNTYGERVNTIAEGKYSSGLYQMVWDGRTNARQRVASGIYFIQIIFNGRTAVKKVVLMENNGYAVDPIPTNNLLNNLESVKIKYTVVITADTIIDLYVQTDYEIVNPDENNFIVSKHVPIPYRVEGNFLSVYNIDSNTYHKIFIKGVNLGDGLPGAYPGDLAVDSLTYLRWFKKMSETGFNAVRIYTLHFPRFYSVLDAYNKQHPDSVIYLLQGIWLDEDTTYALHNNFYKYAAGYDSDVKELVDCVHGKKNIAPRLGRAYGNFNTDASRWIIGYIAGREVSPSEVIATDTNNATHNTYNGTSNAIALPIGGTPFTCWIAERLDNLIRYERTTYHHERPVSFTSWPTLDPLIHSTEHPNYGSSEDVVQVDLNKIVLKNAPAGFFLSYHAYPYFPDFISADPGYQSVPDSIGYCPYLGYLSTLKSVYKYPLIVAEFGVPSSWGNAHFEFTGMSQGGEDEIEQGNMNVRMLKDIYQAGCAGGCMFAWINENFKNSWITEPSSCGIDRRILWHNLASPEENFGLLKFVEDPPTYNHWAAVTPITTSRITKVQADYDNEYFYTKVYYNGLSNTDSLYIGYDTYGDGVGQDFFPNHINTIYNRCEFMLIITTDSANLYVTIPYDNYSSSHKFPVADSAQQVFHSGATEDIPWNLVRWKNNFPDDCIYNAGILKNCTLPEVPSSNNAVVRYPDHVEVRIPWHFLNFTDPSDNEVLDCETCTGQGKRPHEPPISMLDNSSLPPETTYTTGIALSVLIGNDQADLIETSRFLWEPWGINQSTGLYESPSPVKEVEKLSLPIIKNCLRNYPFTPY